MNHKYYAAWIFVFLILTLFLTSLYPRPGMLFFGAVASSLLVFAQVFLVLTSGEQHKETEEEWYEHC